MLSNQFSLTRLTEDKWSCQPLFVIGNDITFSNVIFSYITFLASLSEGKRNKKDASRVKFLKSVFYYIPFGLQNYDSLVKYLSEVDPLYLIYVKSPADSLLKFVPFINTNTNQSRDSYDSHNSLNIPSIIEESPKYLSHEYFSDPSPSSMFRFALQHYALNARFHINIKVWRCEFLTENNKLRIAPFIFTLFAGSAFLTGNRENTMKFSGNLNTNIILSDQGNLKKNVKTRGFAFYNYNRVLGVLPTSDYLVMCVSDAKMTLKPDEGLKAHMNEFQSYSIKYTKIVPDKSSSPFKLLIDEVEYGPVKSFSVCPYPDPLQNDQQLEVQIASFVPSWF
jgi:hypothetical protein